MYRVTLICKGVPIELGQAGAIDIAEEFTHRPWQQNVLCEWDGEQLLLHAESDWDADGKALLDEFSDAISACIPGTFGYGVEVKSIIVVSGTGISDQEKPSLDDADGNCRQCGHPFNPHIVVA